MKTLYLKMLCAFLLTIFCSGCTSHEEKVQSHLKEIDISLKDKFKVLKYESQGINDFIFQCEIVVTSSDSNRIVNQIKSRKYFTCGIPNERKIEQYKDIEKQAFFKENFYYVDYYDESSFIRKSIFFYPDEKKVKFTYYEE